MNEVYVTGPDRDASSDRVFHVPHLGRLDAVSPGATLFLYLAVFTSRTDVCFGRFRRDALFHETLSLAILGGLYLNHFPGALR